MAQRIKAKRHQRRFNVNGVNACIDPSSTSQIQSINALLSAKKSRLVEAKTKLARANGYVVASAPDSVFRKNLSIYLSEYSDIRDASNTFTSSKYFRSEFLNVVRLGLNQLVDLLEAEIPLLEQSLVAEQQTLNRLSTTYASCLQAEMDAGVYIPPTVTPPTVIAVEDEVKTVVTPADTNDKIPKWLPYAGAAAVAAYFIFKPKGKKR